MCWPCSHLGPGAEGAALPACVGLAAYIFAPVQTAYLGFQEVVAFLSSPLRLLARGLRSGVKQWQHAVRSAPSAWWCWVLGGGYDADSLPCTHSARWACAPSSRYASVRGGVAAIAPLSVGGLSVDTFWSLEQKMLGVRIRMMIASLKLVAGWTKYRQIVQALACMAHLT